MLHTFDQTKQSTMKFTDYKPLCYITTELAIAAIDTQERTFILIDIDNEYLIDMDITNFELFVRSQKLLFRSSMERHHIYEFAVTVTEEISFSRWLEETPEKEIAMVLSNYYLTIGYKNLRLELEGALLINKLSEI